MHSGIGRIAITIIVLLLSSGSETGLSDSNELYRAYGKAQPLPVQSSIMSSSTDHPVLSEEEMRQWKTYTDNSITFRYPNRLVLRKRNGRIFLTHSIKFKHLDPCDYSGDDPPLRNLIDFKMSLEIVNGDGHFEIPITEEKVKIGMLNGEFICSCSEGCGEYQYKFPIGENKTLIVKRDIIGIFSPAAQRFGDEDRARKRPGIIDPDMEERFFDSILSTLKIRKADQLKSN